MFKVIKGLFILVFSFFAIISCKSSPSVELYEAVVTLSTKETVLLVLEIEHNDTKTFTGYLTIPQYRIHRIRLENTLISGDSIYFSYSKFNTVFKGKYSSLGIEGIYRLGTEDLNVTFHPFDLLKRRPQTPQPPFSYVTKEVSFHSKDNMIRYSGTLTLPEEKGKFTAVILLTGSGAQDRDETIYYHKPFFILADYLTKRGFAVLRLDDRGVGGTTGGHLPNTTSDFADDALEAVSYLKLHKNVDSHSIGFIGHSEGGVIAFIAASKSHDVGFIVSLASPGLSGNEIALKQREQNLYQRTVDTLSVNNVLKFWDKTFDIINKNRPEDREVLITKVFKNWLMEHKDSPKSLALMDYNFAEFDNDSMVDKYLRTNVGPYLRPWTRNMLSYNPDEIFKRIKTPILALNGDKDELVDASTNLKKIKSLGKKYDIPIDIVEIPNMNHFLQTTTNGSITKVYENQETVSPEILDYICHWIDKNK